MAGCLEHIRVLDFSRVFAGPWAAQMFAGFGADVIKVEHVKGRDDVRRMGVPHLGADGEPTGEASSFLKRFVAADLSKPGGQELARRLIAEADVLIGNFKTGMLARFGLDYEAVAKVNPQLVYCSITGFGQSGPMARLPGYDPIFQTMSGLLSMTGAAEGQPGAGPALVRYSISSGFFGSLSGSVISNMLSTGSMTIPTMKRCGYPPAYAGAIVMAVSTAILSILMMAAASERYIYGFGRKAKGWEALVLLFGGLCLLIPETISDIAGLASLVLVLGVGFMTRSIAVPAPSSQKGEA